jgi:hypothetical protein
MRLFRLLFLTNCLVLATTASAQTITCSSNDMGRHYCRANTSNGVKLVYQRSGSACTMGVSWGYDNNGIWVDHGCRADFALGAGGGQGANQGNPNNALLLCKNTASQRLPGVPLAYISVYRGTDAGNGSYMINFNAQPPNARHASGFCIVSRNGQLQNFQFDPGSGGNQGGGNNGGGNNNGQTPQDVMIACKNAVSARMPNVPLAYIQVNQPRVNGGSMLSNFRVQPPNGPYASGSCDVFKNGRVNLQFNN